MTLRAGKGSAGGMYRYYTCSTKARQGERGCRGLAVPMDKLDRAVVDHLEWRLLDPVRLTIACGSTRVGTNVRYRPAPRITW
jgi:site-specific DNA recombinase